MTATKWTIPSEGRRSSSTTSNLTPPRGMDDRNGTDVDASALAARFYELGFDLEILHNQSVKEMQNILEKCKQIF